MQRKHKKPDTTMFNQAGTSVNGNAKDVATVASIIPATNPHDVILVITDREDLTLPGLRLGNKITRELNKIKNEEQQCIEQYTSLVTTATNLEKDSLGRSTQASLFNDPDFLKAIAGYKSSVANLAWVHRIGVICTEDDVGSKINRYTFVVTGIGDIQQVLTRLEKNSELQHFIKSIRSQYAYFLGAALNPENGDRPSQFKK